MYLLSQSDWVGLFIKRKLSWDSFLKKYKVESGDTIVSLEEYIKKHRIPISDIKNLYDHITNNSEYLKRFYNTSLVPFVPQRIIDPPMSLTQLNNNEQVKYKNIVRNMYFEDILKKTQSGMENIKTYMNVLDDLYNNYIIDYKLLTPSARFYTKEGRIGSVFSSFYFRASILNPYVIYSLNMKLLHGMRIFTPTLGWSSYCYGFLECPDVVEYVGNDIIPSVCKNTKTFSRINYPNKHVDIWCQPSEDLLTNTKFMRSYKGHFDVVFFSPPYYRLELYEGKNQSTTRYSSYEEWLRGYWENTIQLCWHVLAPGGRLCYIISNYKQKDNTSVNLIKDMNIITKKVGFKQKGRIMPMWNKTVAVNVDTGDNHESICLFIRRS